MAISGKVKKKRRRRTKVYQTIIQYKKCKNFKNCPPENLQMKFSILSGLVVLPSECMWYVSFCPAVDSVIVFGAGYVSENTVQTNQTEKMEELKN